MNFCIKSATVLGTADLFHIRTSVTENALSHQDLQALGITPAALEAMISSVDRHLPCLQMAVCLQL